VLSWDKYCPGCVEYGRVSVQARWDAVVDLGRIAFAGRLATPGMS
jgi:hypothetical protein